MQTITKDTRITDIGLSARVSNGLRRNGIFTVGMLYEHGVEDLQGSKHFGNAMMKEVMQVMDKLKAINIDKVNNVDTKCIESDAVREEIKQIQETKRKKNGNVLCTRIEDTAVSINTIWSMRHRSAGFVINVIGLVDKGYLKDGRVTDIIRKEISETYELATTYREMMENLLDENNKDIEYREFIDNTSKAYRISKRYIAWNVARNIIRNESCTVKEIEDKVISDINTAIQNVKIKKLIVK